MLTEKCIVCEGVPSTSPQSEDPDAPLWAWGEEDHCFHILHLVARTDDMEDLNLRTEILALFNQHYGECGSCWPNVLMAAENFADALKKRMYYKVYYASEFALMKEYGGDVVVAQDAEGQRISIKYPTYMNEPWVGGEVYLPVSLAQEALIILDVRNAALFEDPSPILHSLDKISASEVQTFDQPLGRGIQWWTIVGDRPTRLLVRWQGKTRSAAKDWTLLPRYERLVAKFEEGPQEDMPGKAAIKLRELALKYNGQSQFAGNTQKTLEYRAKDAWRRDAKDAFGKSEGAELDDPSRDDTSKEGRRVLKGVTQKASKLWQPVAEKMFAGLDLSMRRKRLKKYLTKRQQRILGLKAAGLSDEAAGTRLGLRRETVNREVKEIKKKAARIKV